MICTTRIVLVLLISACSDKELPAEGRWAGEDVRPALEHPFFSAHPKLNNLSLYATFVEGDPDKRPDHQHRGAFAVGNGRAFSLAGLVDPINTLHSIVGPSYEKGPRFFSDTSVALELDGETAPFLREWIARVRGAPILVTRSDASSFTQYTIDFAPHPAGRDPLEVPPVIVRIVLLVSRASVAQAAALRFDREGTTVVTDGFTVDHVTEETRYMAYLAWDGQWRAGPKATHIDLGSIAPGGTAQASAVLATATSTAGLHTINSDLARTDAATWLEDTLTFWEIYSAKSVQVDVADERIEDLYDGMRVGIRVQQSAAGAVCPMSEYTGVWLRDTIGPVRFFLSANLIEEAKKTIDYMYGCHVHKGDLSNACDSGLHPDQFGTPPDWDALGPMGGRIGAESPTYLPLMYERYVLQTGDWSLVEDRWSYLKRSLSAQNMDDQGRQPFSGDETFRTAMSAALGYALAEQYEEISWSANSSFLMVRAADFMIRAAQQLGKTEDVPLFTDLRDRAKNALQNHFLQDGYYAPFILKEGEVPEKRPYEDVNLKPLWCGSHAPDDPVALSNLNHLRSVAGRGDGTVQSPLHEMYDSFLGLPIKEGINTGMVPGFYLYNLTSVGDPEAALAFNALHDYADNAGQYGEYMVYDDRSALSPIYDGGGVLGDYTAHHRPWEGGINIDAYLFYLTGLEVANDRSSVRLRPHLPNSLRRLTVSQLRGGPLLGTLIMSRTQEDLSVTVTAETTFTLQFELPVPSEEEEISGMEPSGEQVTLPGGERVVRYPAVEVGKGSTQTYRILFE